MINNLKLLIILILATVVVVISVVITNKPPTNSSIDRRFEPVNSMTEGAKLALKSADNSFVAKILRVIGNENTSLNITGTKYEVTVLYSIKGYVGDEITVYENSGYRDGVLYVDNSPLPNEDPNKFLMKTGNTYIINSNYDSSRGVYVLISGLRGSILVSDDSDLSPEQLRNIVMGDRTVQTYISVYEETKCRMLEIFGFCLTKYLKLQ